MLKLMKLELRKHKGSGFLKGGIIANLCIIALIILMYYTSKGENDRIFPSYDEAFTMVSTMVQATFTIFAAVLISKLIICEYTNKTINLMFMYPINRKKIIGAKLAIIVIFTFSFMLISSITTSIVICIMSSFDNFIPEKLTLEIIAKNIGMFITHSIAFTGVSLIPLFVGMKRKSIQSTIVTSVIIVSLLSSSNGNVSLSSFIIIPLTLAFIGVITSYLAIRNIEHTDIT